ncbi:YcjF family protein [Sorangium sp. So ce1128]
MSVTQVNEPGKKEFKEEIKTETSDGVKYETKHEYKVDSKGSPGMSDPNSRVSQAEAIIHRNVLWALGAGIVPIPIFDFVSITGVQVKLLKELSDLYGVSFTSSLAKKIVGSLLAGLGSVGLGTAIGFSISKFLPVIGTTLGAVSVPVFAGAFTHATGKIFMMHFESGGTLLDFNPQAMRAHFNLEYEKAKASVGRVH